MTRQLSVALACVFALLSVAASATAQTPAGLKDLRAWKQEQVEKNHGKATGAVEGEMDDGTRFFCEVVDWWNDTNRVVAVGNVVYVQGNSRISADRAELDTKTGLGTFFNASGSVSIADRVNRDMFGGQEADMYFRGETVERLGPKKYRITNGGFTTCLQPTPRWYLTSGTVTVNVDRYAMATNSLLKVKSVPVFYLPFIYYPINKEDRATGLLMPVYGTSTITGFSLSNAFFWAISRSQDATIMHDWYSKSGQSVGGEYRYIRGMGSDGNVRVRLLNEHERTYQSYGSTVTMPARRSFEIVGSASEALPGRLRLRANANYFSDMTVQQTYHLNINDASRRTRGYGLNLSGAWGLNSLNSSFGWNEIFFGASDTWRNGSAPKITINRALQRLGPVPVFWAASTEFSNIVYANQSGGTKADQGLRRWDVAPQIRLPFSKYQFFTVDSSLSYHATYYSESYVGGVQSPVSIWRRYVQMEARTTGPVFSRVFVTPENGFADRFKHVIEPSFSIARTTRIDNFDQVVKIDGGDYTVGGTTRMTYGFSTRLIARRKEGGRTVPRDLVAVAVRQSYYTDSRASQYDPSYGTSFLGRAKSNFSTVQMTATSAPAPRISGQLRLEWDPDLKAFQTKSANGTVAAGAWLEATAGWSQRRLTYTRDQYRMDNFVNADTTLRTPGNKVGGTYSMTYDLGRKTFLQSRIVGYYNAQCCGFAAEFQTYNYPQVSSLFPVPQDRRFNLSVTLAGLGTFSNLFGALGGGTGR